MDVAARYAERLGIGTEVRCLRGNFGKDVSPAEIEGCDLVLSCVDRHLPRALLNRLSYEKAIPLIDMGSAFRVDAVGKVTAGAGRVIVLGLAAHVLPAGDISIPTGYASNLCRKATMRVK